MEKEQLPVNHQVMIYSHEWVAGSMYVHDEDVQEVAQTRTVECNRCEDTYPSARYCPNGADVAWLLEGTP